MTKSKLQPGMMTYDDGRSYEEQCREISDNASGKSEAVIDKATMEAILKASVRRFPKDMVDSLMWPPAEYDYSLEFKDGHIIKHNYTNMTRDQYRNRLSEIYNQIGELSSERTSLIADRMNLVSAELEKLGIRYGQEYILVVNKVERLCTFNGVRCNSQYLVYMEWLYCDNDFDRYAMPQPIDINNDITIRLTEGCEIDYWEFMHKFV